MSRARAVRPSWPLLLLRAALVFIVSCLAAAPVVIYNVHTYRAVNFVDEGSYIDYLAKVDHGHVIVAEGETTGTTLDAAVQCRGLGTAFVGFTGYAVKPNPAACAGGPHREYVIRNAADVDPPTYYLLTDVGVKVLRGVGVTQDLVQAGRLVGIIWAGLGLSLLFLLSRLFGAGRIAATLTCLVALVTSGLYEYWSYITPHAADLAVGAAAAILTLLWSRRRLPTWVLLPAGAVPVLIEASDLTVSATLLLFVLVAAWTSFFRPEQDRAAHSPDLRRLLLGAATLAVGLAAGSVGWLAVRKHYALTSTPAYERFYAPHFELHFLVDQVGSFLRPFQPDIGVVVGIWAIGSVIAYASDRDMGHERQAMAVALVPVLAFGSLLFVVSDYVTEHQYHDIHPRYSLSIVPLVLAMGATNLRSRWAKAGAVLVIGICCYFIVHPVG